jgi:hypothetical protein
VIPGPYAICHTTLAADDSDATSYATLRFGYNTAAQAHEALQAVATEVGVSADECVVIRQVEASEADAFAH